jgi:hypothetical protein
MATTFTSSKVASTVQEREFHGGVNSISATYTITGAFVINDVVQMVKVPFGARILYCKVTVPALDSSTGVVWSLGDGGDDDRYITGATTGRSGAAGVSVINTATSEYTYTADDTIDFKVTTAATGTAATTGDITVDVLYTMTA